MPNISISSGHYTNTTAANLSTSPWAVGNGSLTISDLSFEYNPRVKKYEVYEIEEDLLSLSVAWKRLRDSKTAHFSKLLDPDLFDKLTDEDRTKAGVIRDYYSKKIMMWKLRGNGKLTAYREDLNKFIHSDGMKFTENMFGLVYRLPDFHVYDNQMDDIYLRVEKNHADIRKYMGIEKSIKLKPLSKIIRKTKNMNVAEYWFKSENDMGVTLNIDHKNPLLHVWDHTFHSMPELTITAKLFPKDRDGFNYLQAAEWKVGLD